MRTISTWLLEAVKRITKEDTKLRLVFVALLLAIVTPTPQVTPPNSPHNGRCWGPEYTARHVDAALNPSNLGLIGFLSALSGGVNDRSGPLYCPAPNATFTRYAICDGETHAAAIAAGARSLPQTHALRNCYAQPSTAAVDSSPRTALNPSRNVAPPVVRNENRASAAPPQNDLMTAARRCLRINTIQRPGYSRRNNDFDYGTTYYEPPPQSFVTNNCAETYTMTIGLGYDEGLGRGCRFVESRSTTLGPSQYDQIYGERLNCISSVSRWDQR